MFHPRASMWIALLTRDRPFPKLAWIRFVNFSAAAALVSPGASASFRCARSAGRLNSGSPAPSIISNSVKNVLELESNRHFPAMSLTRLSNPIFLG